jgi:hypothetical protein
MPQLGFEPMIPAFERAKTVHALPRSHCDRLFIGLYFLHKDIFTIFNIKSK